MTCTIISTDFEKNIPCKNESENPYISIKNILRTTIWQMFIQGYTDFFVNCEYGVPLWSAEIICALKLYNNIRLHIVMPYEEQSKDWSENLRDRFYIAHENSDSVEIMYTQYHSKCYNEADRFMIDNSNIVLIFTNGNEKSFAEKYSRRTGVKFELVDRGDIIQ